MNIFLNYASEDEFFASTLFIALESAGYGVMYHADGIVGGENWTREIQEAIKRCDGFVSLLSPDYARSYDALTELSFALQANKPIYLIVIKPIDPKSILLQETPYLDISENPRTGIQKILDFLNAQEQASALQRVSEVAKRAADDIKIAFDLPSLPSPDRIFIAYSHKQQSLAQSLFNLLVKNRKAVFYDAKIKAGATWRQTIQKALDDATHLIVIWTLEAAESDEVEREVSYALSEKKIIVPILSRDIPKLPYHLHGLHYIVLEEDVVKIEQDLLKALNHNQNDEGIWN